MADKIRLREVNRRIRLQNNLVPWADPESMGIGLKRCPVCQLELLLEEQTCPCCEAREGAKPR